MNLFGGKTTQKRHYNSPSVGASKRRSDNIFGDAMPRQRVHISHVIENLYPYSGSLFDKRQLKGNLCLSLVGKLGCLPCHLVHSLHKKKEEKKIALKNNCDIFRQGKMVGTWCCRAVTSPMQCQCQIGLHVHFFNTKQHHLTTKYGLFRLHAQNTVLYQIFSPGPSSFFFQEKN